MLNEQERREYHSGDPGSMGECIHCQRPVWEAEYCLNPEEDAGFENDEGELEHTSCYRWEMQCQAAEVLSQAVAEWHTKTGNPPWPYQRMAKLVEAAAKLIEYTEISVHGEV